MSIKHCDIHGHWDSDVFDECPRCLIYIGVLGREEKARKTFLGMTAVGWFMFGYIAIVLIAMAWIVTAHNGVNYGW